MTIADHPAGRLFVAETSAPALTAPAPAVPSTPAPSAPAAATAATRVRPTTWSKVDTGFYVASRAGEYVGSVDTTPDGHFVAFDPTSAPIGRFVTLADAKSAVLSWRPERTRMRDRRLAIALRPVAAAAGLVAGATAALGALLTVFPN